MSEINRISPGSFPQEIAKTETSAGVKSRKPIAWGDNVHDLDISEMVDIHSGCPVKQEVKDFKSESSLILDRIQDLTLQPQEGKTVYLPYIPSLKNKLSRKLGLSENPGRKASFTYSLGHLLKGGEVDFLSYTWSKQTHTYRGEKVETGWHLKKTAKDKPVKNFDDLKDLYKSVYQTSQIAGPNSLPKAEAILEQMTNDYMAMPSEGKIVYQPMILENKQMKNIEYNQAGDLLAKKQAVYFQPQMWTQKRRVPGRDGFKVETDGYFHLENLGEMKPRVLGYQDPKAKLLPVEGEALAPSKVSSLEELREFWQIERMGRW